MPEPGSPPVAVVVVTWNGREHLRRCLEALAGQTYPNFQVIVVDNASDDGSAEMVAGDYPAVRLVRNERNLGFAAANNVGILASDAPYLATLNNDAAPEPGWLAALVRAAAADASLGSVASRMVFASDPETINSCGIALDPAGIAWDLFGGRPAHLVDRPREVFGPCAGAALYRRAMLDDVGLFDSEFFAYLEDVDLAWRARLRGWRCILAPDAAVRHTHAGTLGEGSPLKRYLLARNKVWTIAKNVPGPDLRRWLPLIVAYDVGAAAFGAWRQRDWASVQGRLAGLWRLPAALSKRRAIQARRTAGLADLRHSYAALAAPWDVPKRYRHLTRTEGRGLRAQVSATTRLNPQPSRRSQPSLRARARRWVLRGLGTLLRTPARPSPQSSVLSPQSSSQSSVLSPQSSPLRLVVLRPDHLGDVLLSRPAVELLRSAVPTAQITVVVGPWSAPSLQGLDVRVATFAYPGFQRSATAPVPAVPALRGPYVPLAPRPYLALLALANRLRRERYDAALILRPDHWWGALACAVAGIPVRVGHDTPETAPFLTHALARPEAQHSVDGGVAAVAELLRALGIAPGSAPGAVRFAPSARAMAQARGWLDAHVGRRRPVVAIHPGAGAQVKMWPPRRWAAVVNGLGDVGAVVLTGGPEDGTLIDGISRLACAPTPSGLDFTWDGLAGVYRQVDLVLGMDSGPLHLAAAVDTPTVRMYGPTDPRVYGPAGDLERHRMVRSALPCSPCGNLVAPPCGFLADPPCLADTAVEDLLAAARKILAAATPP